MKKFSQDGILLADVPNAGVSRVDPNARSGNPRHDARSGKFGSAAKPGQKGPEKPDQIEAVDWFRMLDAVRDAAREFDAPGEGDIREFLAGRAKNPGQVDIDGFLKMVQNQRLDDAVDLLDQQMRSSGILPRSRRKVKISAPRGYIRKLLGSFDSDQLALVMHRLEAKGHDKKEIDDWFNGRVKDDTKIKATSKRDAIAASDMWEMGDPFEDFDTETLDTPIENSQPTIINLIVPPQDNPEQMANKIMEILDERAR